MLPEGNVLKEIPLRTFLQNFQNGDAMVLPSLPRNGEFLWARMAAHADPIKAFSSFFVTPGVMGVLAQSTIAFAPHQANTLTLLLRVGVDVDYN